jgi:hypothetical protein
MWDAALANYRRLAAIAKATADNDPDADAADAAASFAMDYLIEAVRAPDLDAVMLKIELGRERSAPFDEPLLEDHVRGILADFQCMADGGRQ